MDFHAAMETFAEAWVAANTQTAVNSSETQSPPKSMEDLPTLLPKEQLVENRQTSPNKAPSPDKSAPTSSAVSSKTLPIHCIVEQSSTAVDSPEKPSSSTVELDSYAIVSSSTLFNEIVRAAMLKLGYTTTEAVAATGAIQFKNWKPLSFDVITDNSQLTVDDVLGELTSVATLRIRLSSNAASSAQMDMKEKLLQLLLNQSQDFLLKAGCPIDKDILAQITSGQSLKDIPNSTKEAFYDWYHQQVNKSHASPCSKESSPDNCLQLSYPTVAHILNSRKTPTLSHGLPRTRPRTSFDPDHEIPRLNHWFQQNQHPSRYQMMQYLEELNLHETRRGRLRKPLDLLNIIHWFKNARAAVRKGIKVLDSAEDGETNSGKKNSGDNWESMEKSDIPELPNKNAVYIISKPNRDHVDYEEGCSESEEDESGEEDEELEPEDLSLPKRMSSSEQSQENESSKTSELSEACKRGSSGSEDSPAKKIKTENSDESGTNSKLNEIKTENLENESEVCSESGTSSGDRNNSPAHTSAGQTPSLMVPMYSVPYPVGIYPGMGLHPMSPHFYGTQFANTQHSLGMTPLDMSRYTSGGAPKLSKPQVSPTNDSDSNENLSREEKRRRHRVFIDPVTEIPLLEHWFNQETHPPHYVIEKYCEELNKLEYRQRYPKLNPKNVQLWFKNHRAKVKRLRLGQALNLNHNGISVLNIPPTAV